MKKLICSILIAVCSVFAGNNVETSPYVDFNVTAHNGVGDNSTGFAAGMGFGIEVLYAVNNDFGIGLNAKTNLTYDEYIVNYYGGTVNDEYGVWSGTIGGIAYIGPMFYVSYMAIFNFSTFHHDTYGVDECGETYDIAEFEYNINDINYAVELGLRIQYHFSMYVAATTHLINNVMDTNHNQFYVGVKYHI